MYMKSPKLRIVKTKNDVGALFDFKIYCKAAMIMRVQYYYTTHTKIIYVS